MAERTQPKCRICKHRPMQGHGSWKCEPCEIAEQEQLREEIEARQERARQQKRDYRRRYREADPERSRRNVYKESIRRRFGMSIEEYEAMLEAQGWRCAAFGCDLRELPTRAIHLDHCHETGKVRGILCRSCNHALGHADDNPDRLEALARYVREHAASVVETEQANRGDLHMSGVLAAR